MLRRLAFCACLVCLGASVSAGPVPLRTEVPALLTLYELQLSPAQLRTLQTLVKDCADKDVNRGPALTGKKRDTLAQLHDALLAGDEVKITEAEENVDEQSDEEEAEVTIHITATSREKVGTFVQMLSAVQAAGYIAAHSDEVPSATHTMLDALVLLDEQPEDADAIREQASDQVALLVSGLDQAKGKAIADKVGAWFDAAKRLSAAERQSKHASLEDEARKIVGDLDPFDALRHWMSRDLAELMSNPELPAALAERLK